MKRFLKLFSIITLLVLVVGLSFACKNKKEETKGSGESLDGTYKITVWVSEIAGVKELTEQQIKDFMDANPGIKIEATVEKVGEGEAATQMITSVEDGADLFCFAQDQLARLVQAGALNPLRQQASATITAENDGGSVAAATVDDKIYCYPLTSDNGYFMFYDKSVISEDKLNSLEDLIKACEDAGRGFSFNLEGSGWYNASFFFATGCTSTWQLDSTGEYTGVNDNFNSDNGVIALKGMQKVLKSSAYVDSASGADFDAAKKSAVVITGTWETDTITKILGDNMGCAKLPSFTVDGKTYQLGSFFGCKLLGTKPQTDANKATLVRQLAQYLTGEKGQTERFEALNWGPSNKVAAASDKVKADVALAAMALQASHKETHTQGQYPGAWWDIAKAITPGAAKASSDAEIKEVLKTYQTAIDKIVAEKFVPVAERKYSVIGGMPTSNWSTDLEMVKGDGNVWTSKEVITFNAEDSFKIRAQQSWDYAYGWADNLDSSKFQKDNDGNIQIKVGGTFKIQFKVLELNSDGEVAKYEVTLVS